MTLQELTVLNFVVYLFFSLLSMNTYHLFFSLLSLKSKNKYKLILSYVAFCVFTNFTFFVFYNSYINLVVGIGGLFVIAFFNYQATIVKKLIAVISITLIGMVIEILVGSIYSIVTINTLHYVSYLTNISLYLFVIPKFLSYLLIRLITIFYTNNDLKYDEKMPLNISIQLILIPMISIVVLVVAFNFFAEADMFLIGFSIITVLTISTNIILFNLYNIINLRLNKATENLLLNQQIEYYSQLYDTVAKERENEHIFKHNLKNNLLSVIASIKEGRYRGAVSEINKLIENNETTTKLYVKIPIINTLLNFKTAEAKEKNVLIEPIITAHGELNIRNSDIANILGNLIDNAVEACDANEAQNDKKIDLVIMRKNNNLFISIKNKYTHQIKKREEKFLSKKRGFKSYGVGLKTVEKLVLENNGVITVKYKDSFFNVEIILFQAF